MPGPIHRKYSKELDAAIFVLRWQGRMSWRDTYDAILNGEAGLPAPIDLPLSTYKDKTARLKAKHGDPRDYIAPAETVDAIREIERAALEVSNKVVRKLQAKSRAAEDGLNANDLARVDKAVSLAQRVKTAPLQESKQARAQREGRKAQQRSPVTALGTLVGTAPDDPTSDTSADSEASLILSTRNAQLSEAGEVQRATSPVGDS